MLHVLHPGQFCRPSMSRLPWQLNTGCAPLNGACPEAGCLASRMPSIVATAGGGLWGWAGASANCPSSVAWLSPRTFTRVFPGDPAGRPCAYRGVGGMRFSGIFLVPSSGVMVAHTGGLCQMLQQRGFSHPCACGRMVVIPQKAFDSMAGGLCRAAPQRAWLAHGRWRC